VPNHVRHPLEKTLSANSLVRVSTGIAKISTDATSTNTIEEYLQAADDTEAPTLDVRATDGSWANVRSWSSAPIDNVQLPPKTLAALGTGSLDGEERWCSDCTINGVLGVAAVWHATASKWTDSQNGTLSN